MVELYCVVVVSSLTIILKYFMVSLEFIYKLYINILLIEFIFKF